MISSLILQMLYSTFDAGNFFVIPGSPAESWKTHASITLERNYVRSNMGYDPQDFIITIVGSELSYRGLWLEHSIVLRALLPLLEDFSSDDNLFSHLKIIVLSGYSKSNYSSAIEVLFPKALVQFFSLNKIPFLM